MVPAGPGATRAEVDTGGFLVGSVIAVVVALGACGGLHGRT
jgi:hypothetical protein